MMPVSPLTAETMLTAISQLVECDRDLAYIIHNYGQPPFWYREAGFPGLVRIILGQQVSVAAANAIYGKLTGLLESLTPEGFLELTEIELKLT